ncbi:MAG: type IV pilus assembly protein PilW, partial [Lentisphaeria bacterium]
GSATAVDEELVQGVENVQVLYGFDSNGSGVANRYLDADGLAFGDWANVVSVRLHLLFRSFVAVASEPQVYRFADATYTPTDRFLRQEVISTIALRN